MNQTQTQRRRLLTAAIAAPASFGLLSQWAHAQTWPSRAVSLIVGFPPGGIADLTTRLVANHLTRALGQPVPVDNRAGAAGNIAGQAVASSAPDGYTLLSAPASLLAINPHLHRMTFDPFTDLVPVAATGRVFVYLMVRANLGVQNVQDLLAMLRARPGQLTFGSAGNGTSSHIAGEKFTSQANVTARHIPYRGAAPALTALIGGEIDFLFDSGPGLQAAQAGRVQLLAVGSRTRVPALPDLPTLHESGLTDFDVDTVFGIYARSGTPAAIVARLSTEIGRIMQSTEVREGLVAIGAGTAVEGSAQELAARVRNDSERFGRIIRERNIRPD
ncbi:MAG: hypothetical protein JM57_03940 [Comamonadaceae bacterium BICA1-1]|nr:MAG: hypothetical protein JM57_03940 [Comamonadaceae bacterium BICA1-1]